MLKVVNQNMNVWALINLKNIFDFFLKNFGHFYRILFIGKVLEIVILRIFLWSTFQIPEKLNFLKLNFKN